MERIVNRRRFVELLHSIKEYCAQTGISPSRFGREAVGDARLVHDMRKGRQLRSATARRVRDYMQTGQPR